MIFENFHYVIIMNMIVSKNMYNIKEWNKFKRRLTTTHHFRWNQAVLNSILIVIIILHFE